MKKPFFLAFGICLTLLFLRGYQRFFYPEIWAEDGTRCLQVVSESGLKSLFQFSDGYFFVVQKIIAYSSIKVFPVERVPLGILLFVWVLTSLVFALFSLRTYEWLVGDVRMRVVGCALFCFAPGLHEVFGNLANLPSLFFFYLCLLAIRNPKEKTGAIDWAGGALAVFSCGTFIVLAPIFLLRRDWKILFVMAFAVGGILTSGTGAASAPLDVLRHIPTLLFPYVVRGLLFQPWLGDTLTSALNNPHIKFWQAVLAGLFVLGAGSILWKKRKDESANLFYLFLFCVCLWPLLGWMARPLSLPRFIGIPELFWKDRYSFISGFVSILFWTWAIGSHRRRGILLSIFVVSHTVLNAYRFTLPRYSERDIWKATVLGKCGKISVEGIPREYDWIYTRECVG